MPALKPRSFLPEASQALVQHLAKTAAAMTSTKLAERVEALAVTNLAIHENECFNLNPATNVMNPRAEALLASGLGTRPSLGYPGAKYETGLEAIEEIEVITAQLCAEIFKADFAEIRVPSGAIANLYTFMALTKPGDAIIAPPPEIAGHVTHHDAGCAGLYGLKIHHAPVAADGYSVDLEGLEKLAQQVRPKLITIGGSLNLFEHKVSDIRVIADGVEAYVLFDAAHQCGLIAGVAWKNPLEEGAHVMSMSTYKSLGGPPSGLLVTNEAEIAEKLDKIAFPGMTANFDAAKSAALAITMLDWREHGKAYAAQMIALSQRLAEALATKDMPVFKTRQGFTRSHQFALEAARFGGGQAASKHLRKAGFLACGIGLPIEPVKKDDLNGLRLGTPELARWGMQQSDMARLADLIAEALISDQPETLAEEVASWRAEYDQIHFIVE